MSTLQIPVRSGGPDAVQGMASTEIGAGLHLILHTDEVTRRIQTDTCLLSQPPNDVAAQAPAWRFSLGRTLRGRRLDKARGAR